MVKRLVLSIAMCVVMVAGGFAPPGALQAEATQGYLVVFAGQVNSEGGFTLALAPTEALALVAAAGGTVTADLTSQIGVMLVSSPNEAFADLLRASPFVESVGRDFGWKAYPTYEEALASGRLVLVEGGTAGGGPEPSQDVLEGMQWSMIQIHAPEAHGQQAGWRAVDVGILDTGIDGAHLDFVGDTAGTNVDCARGRDFIPLGPGVGNPVPCVDNNFHGTHVAGIVAAQANVHGVVGVAPNVTLVPVKVCDSAGYCYAGSVVAGITYAGDAKLDVINMSFFTDDDQLLGSTEFKCMDDPTQRAFRQAVERAIQYARERGVTPVAALGNSDTDLAHPPAGNECEVVPAESSGVIGTMALGPGQEKARYSSYGSGATDVAAPGGNGTTGNCAQTVLSTLPGNSWGCFQGTSMASPHAAGVAALIVSQFGRLGADGDVELRPTTVENYLQASTVDIGEKGYDECFGNGRIDAERAVQHDTSYEAAANPPCGE